MRRCDRRQAFSSDSKLWTYLASCPIAGARDVTEYPIKHSLLTRIDSSFCLEEVGEHLRLDGSNKDCGRIDPTQLMNQHIRTLGVGIVGNDVALGLEHIFVGHLRNYLEELTGLATGSGAHIQDGMSRLRRQHDGWDHAHGFLTRKETCCGLDLEPLM